MEIDNPNNLLATFSISNKKKSKMNGLLDSFNNITNILISTTC